MPDAFGLVAAVNTLYFALVMFSDLGVWQSVVKSERGLQARFLGTAWSVQLMRAVLLCGMVLLLAAAHDVFRYAKLLVKLPNALAAHVERAARGVALVPEHTLGGVVAARRVV